MDFVGGTSAPLTDLAHVAGIASHSQPDVVRRVLAEVAGRVDARGKYSVERGIDSIETYRQRRVEGRVEGGWGMASSSSAGGRREARAGAGRRRAHASTH